MQYRQIPGLEEVKSRLQTAVEKDQLSHALLFSSIEGGAALPMALALAQRLVCKNPVSGDACGKCPSCQKFQKHVHPDVQYLFPNSATTKVKEPQSKAFLTEWRTFLSENPYGNLQDWASALQLENKQLFLGIREARNLGRSLMLSAAEEGGYRIVIVWYPEMMRKELANALLKRLEEPNKRTLFLLVSFQTELLLDTIISRVQQITLPPFKEQDVAWYLTEQAHLDEVKAKQLSLISEGSIGKALNLNSAYAHQYFSLFSEWMRACFSLSKGLKQYATLLDIAQQFKSLGRENQKNLLRYTLSMLGYSLRVGVDKNQPVALEEESKSFVSNFSKQIIKGNRLENTQHIMEKAISDIARNVNGDIVFMDASFQMARVFRS